MELVPPVRKTIDLEGRLVKGDVRKADLTDLIYTIREHRLLAETTPLTLQSSDYAHAVHQLDKVIDRAKFIAVIRPPMPTPNAPG